MVRRPFHRLPRRAHVLRLGAWLLAASAALPVAAGCIDEAGLDTGAASDNAAAGSVDPRAQLAEMVGTALARSQAVGAARLLADAALQDVEEVRAGKALQASLNAGLGPAVDHANGSTQTAAVQARAAISIGQLLFDGGRTDRLVDWRGAIAESARQGQLTQQEQIALNTVALAMERSRFRLQAQVYAQYARKMSCLVQALETIVAADRGRASELVQAKKSQQQAELQRVQAQSQARQIEVKLRRYVGDGLPTVQGLSSVLLTVPELPVLVADVEYASEIAQLGAQAQAAERYAAAVEAGNRPQVSWSFGGSVSAGTGGNSATIASAGRRSGSLGLGVSVSIPLLNPGIAPASEAARLRAQAASLQRAEAVEGRRYRVMEVHEQTLAAFDRARRVAAVLRDSDQVRNFTLQQWQQLGRRSLFDVMAAEGEHYGLRVAHVNALHDGQQLNALLLSLGRGVGEWLR